MATVYLAIARAVYYIWKQDKVFDQQKFWAT